MYLRLFGGGAASSIGGILFFDDAGLCRGRVLKGRRLADGTLDIASTRRKPICVRLVLNYAQPQLHACACRRCAGNIRQDGGQCMLRYVRLATRQ